MCFLAFAAVGEADDAVLIIVGCRMRKFVALIWGMKKIKRSLKLSHWTNCVVWGAMMTIIQVKVIAVAMG